MKLAFPTTTSFLAAPFVLPALGIIGITPAGGVPVMTNRKEDLETDALRPGLLSTNLEKQKKKNPLRKRELAAEQHSFHHRDLAPTVREECSVDGTLRTSPMLSNSTQRERIVRTPPASTCAGEAYPGLHNNDLDTTYYFEVFGPFVATGECVTVNYDAGTCGPHAHATAYDAGGYDPDDQAQGYLGDIGTSVSQPFSFPTAGPFYIVVNSNGIPAYTDSSCDVSFTVEHCSLFSETPSSTPSGTPSLAPSLAPSIAPSEAPSGTPSAAPSNEPSLVPSVTPSLEPSSPPSSEPSNVPTAKICAEDGNLACDYEQLQDGSIMAASTSVCIEENSGSQYNECIPNGDLVGLTEGSLVPCASKSCKKGPSRTIVSCGCCAPIDTLPPVPSSKSGKGGKTDMNDCKLAFPFRDCVKEGASICSDPGEKVEVEVCKFSKSGKRKESKCVEAFVDETDDDRFDTCGSCPQVVI
mmetsp:Transcript_70505/g.106653  ORF Transcript_70505/g.106653 Transcript_70505/m.106653 type:complete len:468 (+) Transcript_70505:119-1522(+)